MPDLAYHPDDFKSFIEESVPAFQRNLVLSALNIENATDQAFDLVGTTLTGEQKSLGFILLTGAQGGAAGKSIWGAIKREIYDLLCTNSKKYANDRKEGALTIKNLILVVATSIAASFHVAIGVITGAVTVGVMGALRVGKNAWCEINKGIGQ